MLNTGDKAGSPYLPAALRLDRRGSVIASPSEDSWPRGCVGDDSCTNSGFAAAIGPARALPGKGNGDALLGGGCFVEAELAAEHTDSSRCVHPWLGATGAHLSLDVGITPASATPLVPAFFAPRCSPLVPLLHLRKSVAAKEGRDLRVCRHSCDAMVGRESNENLLRRAEWSPAASAASTSETLGGRPASENAQAKPQTLGNWLDPGNYFGVSFTRLGSPSKAPPFRGHSNGTVLARRIFGSTKLGNIRLPYEELLLGSDYR